MEQKIAHAVGGERVELPAEFEDHRANVRRSLARRGRSDATVRVYRKSYDAFWGWATARSLADPAAVDHGVISRRDLRPYLRTPPTLTVSE